jgi:hypothetical protein
MIHRRALNTFVDNQRVLAHFKACVLRVPTSVEHLLPHYGAHRTLHFTLRAEWCFQRVKTSIPPFYNHFNSVKEETTTDRVSHNFHCFLFQGVEVKQLFCSSSTKKNYFFDQKGSKSGETYRVKT